MKHRTAHTPRWREPNWCSYSARASEDAMAKYSGIHQFRSNLDILKCAGLQTNSYTRANTQTSARPNTCTSLLYRQVEDKSSHFAMYRNRKEAHMWGRRREPQLQTKAWAYLHQGQSHTCLTAEVLRGSCQSRTEAWAPAKADRPSLPLSRTSPHIWQCKQLERTPTDQDQLLRRSEGERPKHVFTRSTISTKILIAGMTPYLVQTTGLESFVWPGSDARAFVHQKQNNYKFLITFNIPSVLKRRDLKSFVLQGLLGKALDQSRGPARGKHFVILTIITI